MTHAVHFSAWILLLNTWPVFLFLCVQLFSLFGKKLEDENKYGRIRDWNVDLIPKFIMAEGT